MFAHGSARLRGGCGGQGTVEAAFALPVLLALMVLAVQPGIYLYDRMVMQSAVEEGCRLLATSDGQGCDEASVRSSVTHRLLAIPSEEHFHVREADGGWDVAVEGSAASSEVGMEISTKVRPLPLIDLGGRALGALDGDGYMTITVRASRPTQPSWAAASPAGTDPRSWVGAWCR